jgi:hypothetical protein
MILISRNIMQLTRHILKKDIWLMNRLSRTTLLITFLISPDLYAHSQSKHPAVYVDKEACPFECCTYQKWTTEESTIAYARPDRRAKRLGKFKAGSQVTALTGEVRTRAGRYVILQAHGKYKPGDVLWVYTPLGEGFYKVWFKGKMYQEQLVYINGPFEWSLGSCEEAPDCWGKLDKDLQAEWWVKIKSAHGWVGWTNQADNFSNKDGCA